MKVSRVGINVYIQLKQFFLLSTKSVASTVYKNTAHLKTNQNWEDNVRDNENWPVFLFDTFLILPKRESIIVNLLSIWNQKLLSNQIDKFNIFLDGD